MASRPYLSSAFFPLLPVWFVVSYTVNFYIRIPSGPEPVFLYDAYSYRERGLARVIVRDEANRRNIVCSKPKQKISTSQKCQNLPLKLANIMTGAISEARRL